MKQKREKVRDSIRCSHADQKMPTTGYTAIRTRRASQMIESTGFSAFFSSVVISVVTSI